MLTEGARQDLELLTVEDLVVGIYQQKFLKEPSKTWVRSLLDVSMWDYSSNTRCPRGAGRGWGAGRGAAGLCLLGLIFPRGPGVLACP